MLIQAILLVGVLVAGLVGVRWPGNLRDALVRHPIYGGILLLSLAWSLALSPWALIPTGALAIALVFKSRLEERWLIDRHPAYAGYRERVRRRFVPYLW